MYRINKLSDEIEASFGRIKDDHFDFQQIEAYFKRKAHKDCLQAIDDKTCEDIDFDDLFTFLDRTISKVGQQFLYNKLREVPLESKHADDNEKLIDKLNSSSEFRCFVQSHLLKLKDKKCFYIASLFQEGQLQTPSYFWILRLLQLLSFALVLLVFIRPVAAFPLGMVMLTNGIIHYKNKRRIYQYLGSIPSLLKLHKVGETFFNDAELKELNPHLTASFVSIGKLKKMMSIFTMDTHMQSEMYMVVWALFEFVKVTFLLEPIFLFTILNKLEDKRDDIQAVFEFVGEVDALYSIASLRHGTSNVCIPNIVENQRSMDVVKVYHPLIEESVCNSISIKDKSVLLTGSNMSGKTSFIKTIALNTITALTINTCFAKTFTTPRLRIYSAIRISDDLLNDKSYYLEEVLTIKRMIAESANGVGNLFILDEIFKGTNTIERISAGKAVLSHLVQNQNVVFVSTHDVELADLLKQEYDLYHFSEEVTDENIAFDFTLKKGKLTKKNAIRILELNHYPKSVIEEAIHISESIG